MPAELQGVWPPHPSPRSRTRPCPQIYSWGSGWVPLLALFRALCLGALLCFFPCVVRRVCFVLELESRRQLKRPTDRNAGAQAAVHHAAAFGGAHRAEPLLHQAAQALCGH